MKKNEILEKAKEYLDRKISVIPVGRDKVPLLKWEEYQHRLATKGEVESWWQQWPEANVGIVTGKISGLTIVDVEAGGDISPFPKTATIKTGGGGWHLYYAYHPIKNKARIFHLTDVRGDGGYVVAPPSVHASGEKYEVLVKMNCVPFPAEIFGETKARQNKTDLDHLLNDTISQGERNNSATSICGKLLLRFKESEWENQAWPLFQSWNQAHNQPPLPDRELLTIFRSISQAEQKRKASGADVGEPLLLEEGERYVISIAVTDGFAVFEFEDIDHGSRSLDAVVRCSIEVPGTTPKGFVQRLNILSSSAKEGFVRQLKDSFGGDKKLAWPLIFSQVCELFEKSIKRQSQEESYIVREELSTNYLIKPFIEEGVSNIIFGKGGSGKTYLALQMAVCLATRKPFLGFEPSKITNTLFVDYEDNKHTWDNRITKLLRGMKEKEEVVKDKLFYYKTNGMPLYEIKFHLAEIIRKRNIGMVIIDSAALACGGEPESAEIANRLFNSINRLKTTVLMIAHETKGTEGKNKMPFGSVFFHNCARNTWNIENGQEQEDSVIHVGLFNRKSNNERLSSPKSARIYFGDGFVDINPEDTSRWSKELSMKEQIIKTLKETGTPISISELAKELGGETSTLKNSLADLKKREIVVNPGRGIWALKGMENKTTNMDF